MSANVLFPEVIAVFLIAFLKKMIKCSIRDTKPVNTLQFERNQILFFLISRGGARKKEK